MSDKKTPPAEQPTLEAQLEAERKKNASLKGQVKELTEALKVKEATKGSKMPTVKLSTGHYIFTAPALMVGKEKKSAEDIAKDTELCERLVAKGSGALKLVKTT